MPLLEIVRTDRTSKQARAGSGQACPLCVVQVLHLHACLHQLFPIGTHLIAASMQTCSSPTMALPPYRSS